MKLRHKAIAASPLYKPGNTPLSERIHILVSVDTPTLKSLEQTFWFPKSIITGKALDHLAVYFSIPRSKPLQLCAKSGLVSGKRVVLRNDDELSTQVEDGSNLVLCI